MARGNLKNIERHNLKNLTAEQRREMAIKAGRASAESRKKKKNIKELFRTIGDLPVTEPKILIQLEKLGIPKDEQTWEMAVAASALVKAIKTDNPKLLEFVLELLDREEN